MEELISLKDEHLPDIHARLLLIEKYEQDAMQCQQRANQAQYLQLVFEAALSHALELQVTNEAEEFAEVAMFAHEFRLEAQALFVQHEKLNRIQTSLQAAMTLWLAKLYGLNPKEPYNLDLDKQVLCKVRGQ